jgi:hypothetical protein
VVKLPPREKTCALIAHHIWTEVPHLFATVS